MNELQHLQERSKHNGFRRVQSLNDGQNEETRSTQGSRQTPRFRHHIKKWFVHRVDSLGGGTSEEICTGNTKICKLKPKKICN
jgi:hypothetical protein